LTNAHQHLHQERSCALDKNEERTQTAPATLGDVLYSKGEPPVPEQDWATLVQSIAAGDWIMNQARSRAIDRLRFESRKKRRYSGDVQPMAEAAADPGDVFELREQGESLRAALAALTPGERQAIETTFFAGLTHAEAAARLNQPLGTIKTRIRSGLHKLRETLTAEGEKP
jgi:DNA-directed RNA polymerase specialized sigma24 family protein